MSIQGMKIYLYIHKWRGKIEERFGKLNLKIKSENIEDKKLH